MKIVIVGFAQRGHIGRYLADAARQLGIECHLLDAQAAEARSRIRRSFFWHLRDRRPAQLARFGARVVDTCAFIQPDLVITTGFSPLDRFHIDMLHKLKMTVINYSTDDPWNPALQASWFLSTLPLYDAVFTPRRANLDDFRRSGVRLVYHLPFAYDPEVHRPWPEKLPPYAPRDVLFVGGCDSDRLPLMGALIDAGVSLALFGGYWNLNQKTRTYWGGIVDQDTIRSASAAARICLCLVRRANRDGHGMRSFEAAAIGGCILAEDTADHREFFGPDDHAVRYFSSMEQLVQQAKTLVADEGARRRLSHQLRETLLAGTNTYADRLATILKLCIGGDSSLLTRASSTALAVEGQPVLQYPRALPRS
jgi:spore maturation protein CgeB